MGKIRKSELDPKQGGLFEEVAQGRAAGPNLYKPLPESYALRPAGPEDQTWNGKLQSEWLAVANLGPYRHQNPICSFPYLNPDELKSKTTSLKSNEFRQVGDFIDTCCWQLRDQSSHAERRAYAQFCKLALSIQDDAVKIKVVTNEEWDILMGSDRPSIGDTVSPPPYAIFAATDCAKKPYLLIRESLFYTLGDIRHKALREVFTYIASDLDAMNIGRHRQNFVSIFQHFDPKNCNLLPPRNCYPEDVIKIGESIDAARAVLSPSSSKVAPLSIPESSLDSVDRDKRNEIFLKDAAGIVHLNAARLHFNSEDPEASKATTEAAFLFYLPDSELAQLQGMERFKNSIGLVKAARRILDEKFHARSPNDCFYPERIANNHMNRFLRIIEGYSEEASKELGVIIDPYEALRLATTIYRGEMRANEIAQLRTAENPTGAYSSVLPFPDRLNFPTGYALYFLAHRRLKNNQEADHFGHQLYRLDPGYPELQQNLREHLGFTITESKAFLRYSMHLIAIEVESIIDRLELTSEVKISTPFGNEKRYISARQKAARGNKDINPHDVSWQQDLLRCSILLDGPPDKVEAVLHVIKNGFHSFGALIGEPRLEAAQGKLAWVTQKQSVPHPKDPDRNIPVEIQIFQEDYYKESYSKGKTPTTSENSSDQEQTGQHGRSKEHTLYKAGTVINYILSGAHQLPERQLPEQLFYFASPELTDSPSKNFHILTNQYRSFIFPLVTDCRSTIHKIASPAEVVMLRRSSEDLSTGLRDEPNVLDLYYALKGNTPDKEFMPPTDFIVCRRDDLTSPLSLSTKLSTRDDLIIMPTQRGFHDRSAVSDARKSATTMLAMIAAIKIGPHPDKKFMATGQERLRLLVGSEPGKQLLTRLASQLRVGSANNLLIALGLKNHKDEFIVSDARLGDLYRSLSVNIGVTRLNNKLTPDKLVLVTADEPFSYTSYLRLLELASIRNLSISAVFSDLGNDDEGFQMLLSLEVEDENPDIDSIVRDFVNDIHKLHLERAQSVAPGNVEYKVKIPLHEKPGALLELLTTIKSCFGADLTLNQIRRVDTSSTQNSMAVIELTVGIHPTDLISHAPAHHPKPISKLERTLSSWLKTQDLGEDAAPEIHPMKNPNIS